MKIPSWVNSGDKDEVEVACTKATADKVTMRSWWEDDKNVWSSSKEGIVGNTSVVHTVLQIQLKKLQIQFKKIFLSSS